uniref:Uncharacterized protein n=1 Tax=Plectus sambesii TaxID=2011161 RepID=A0A914WG24_9BILA
MTRLKVLSRSATFAWSPKQLHSRSLAAGTTAQQFDASFSSAAVIDLCPLDDLTADGRLDLNPSVSANVEQRFHKIVWSSFGDAADQSNGLIIGGCDNGVISFYNPQLFGKDKSAKVHESRSHSGHVMALDVNPFQPKLICSGAANSELFIWDLHQPTQPMSPGPKQQPFDQVVSVQWNRKVEHILGTLNAEKALIWDLRKADGPILSMGDLGGRTQWRHLSWHPEEATSLCISSEDDNYPVVQKWDVRFATTPVQHMQFHQRGIVAMDWCPADPDLLVTGGKDHKLFLVNPNTGQFLAEIPYASRNWPHQVSWCDWNPNLIGCASLDGRVTIYSLVGGAESGNASSQQASPAVVPKLADSFPGADFSTFNQTAVAASAAAPIAKPEDTVKLPNVP